MSAQSTPHKRKHFRKFCSIDATSGTMLVPPHWKAPQLALLASARPHPPVNQMRLKLWLAITSATRPGVTGASGS
eukprot:612372-Amphidinium_carterae.1